MDLQAKSASPQFVTPWKLCGLTREADVAQCLSLGVPFAGFNFYKGSKRFITPAQAAEAWRGAVRKRGPGPATTRPVAVVVDMAVDELAAALAVFPELAVLQFHGKETPEELAKLARAAGAREIWKAVGVARPEDLAHASRYLEAASLILFDSAVVPAGTTSIGGSGKTFDWTWLATHRPDFPFGIAGGINARNVRDALSLRSNLIDLSSGVEDAPGIKNAALVDAFAREMRQS